MMYVNWRKQQFLDDLRLAELPCECKNNEDYCQPCQARQALNKGEQHVPSSTEAQD